MLRDWEDAGGFTEEERKLFIEAEDFNERKAVERMRDERRHREDEEELKKNWPNTDEGRVFVQFAQAFAACKKLLEQSPEAAETAQRADGKTLDIYSKLRENLALANRAPRCSYRKSDGQLCRAPKMKGEAYCCMHLAMEAARPKKFSLPALDDANAIQVAITKGAQGLLDGTLDEKCAVKLAQYLRLAASNVSKVRFEPDEGEIG